MIRMNLLMLSMRWIRLVLLSVWNSMMHLWKRYLVRVMLLVSDAKRDAD